MARLPRLVIPHQTHYLSQQGHDRQPVFRDSDDYAAYLAWLREASRKFGVAIHAYVLLPENIDLLITPSDEEGPGKMMQWIGRYYVPLLQPQVQAHRHPVEQPLPGNRGRGAGLVPGMLPLYGNAPGAGKRRGGAGGVSLVQLCPSCRYPDRPDADRSSTVLATGQHALRTRGGLPARNGARHVQGGNRSHRRRSARRLAAGLEGVQAGTRKTHSAPDIAWPQREATGLVIVAI
jgi:REP element-mobilizing transposase RayT